MGQFHFMTEPSCCCCCFDDGGDDALLPLLLQRRGERTNRDGELVVFGREREALGK
jgi:hypothetical protein